MMAQVAKDFTSGALGNVPVERNAVAFLYMDGIMPTKTAELANYCYVTMLPCKGMDTRATTI